MTSGTDVVAAAMRYDGAAYVLGAEHDTDPGFVPAGALDCSELVQAALGDLGVAAPDGHWVQFGWCRRDGAIVPITHAIDTPGALLFVYDGSTQGHVAISRGDGTTIEARGAAWGTGVFPTQGRVWTHGALIPGIDYTEDPFMGMTDDDMDRLAGKIAAAVAREMDARPRTVYSYDEGTEKTMNVGTLEAWAHMERQLIRKAVQKP